MANDLIIAMIAGTETTRNTTIISLCHLIKDKLSKKRSRAEIKKSMEKYKVEKVIDMTHKHTGQGDFEFLNWVINESMRFNPPAPATEEFRITKDCKLGPYTFYKNTAVAFYVYGAHQNPE